MEHLVELDDLPVPHRSTNSIQDLLGVLVVHHQQVQRRFHRDKILQLLWKKEEVAGTNQEMSMRQCNMKYFSRNKVQWSIFRQKRQK